MPDFKDLLNKKVDEQERPALLPAGSAYEGIVTGYDLTEAQNEAKTPMVRFSIKLTGPSEELSDEDLLDEKGKEIKVTDRRMRQDFWLTDEDLWKLSEFIKTCGIDTAGRGFAETLPETRNAPVFVTITQTPDKKKQNPDGSPIIYNNISRLVGQAGPQS